MFPTNCSNYSPCFYVETGDETTGRPKRSVFELNGPDDAAKFAKPRTSFEVETYVDDGEYFPNAFVDDLKEDDAGTKAATLIAIAAIRSPVARDFIFQVFDRLENVFAPECQGWANELKEYVDREIESAFLAYEEERAQLEDEDDEENDD